MTMSHHPLLLTNEQIVKDYVLSDVMTIANCVDFFVSVCVLLSEKPRRARWMGSDHARPQAISLCPRAKDDTLYLLHDCNLLPQFFLCARTGMKRTAAVFFDFQRVDIKHAYRVFHFSQLCLKLSHCFNYLPIGKLGKFSCCFFFQLIKKSFLH